MTDSLADKSPFNIEHLTADEKLIFGIATVLGAYLVRNPKENADFILKLANEVGGWLKAKEAFGEKEPDK